MLLARFVDRPGGILPFNNLSSLGPREQLGIDNAFAGGSLFLPKTGFRQAEIQCVFELRGQNIVGLPELVSQHQQESQVKPVARTCLVAQCERRFSLPKVAFPHQVAKLRHLGIPWRLVNFEWPLSVNVFESANLNFGQLVEGSRVFGLDD